MLGAFHRTLALLDGRVAFSRPKIVTHAGRKNRKKQRKMVEVNLAVLREGEIELARRRGRFIPFDQVAVADAMDKILKDPEKVEKFSSKNKN
ncbi:hypothetical protein Gasu2_13340 [Galdieria sulphuraria]|uniref:Uncharacterized protein n=1 Tax=Galdieria sulphuraria TaxID=130081 RepID=M2XZK8_GALSU|nr:uncharacterized protein Gasu_35790 [Galdieria sulphuraria]EME29009.1 hypothetical protein Gasu_35790 [Galdieria sulphuraria]GJD06946.1 hypothetical protein Gasu2_13340 [Galdieria sulphuraria]|eukprot:XP_005705529.1 hypothetical protein Gasu_35790 [Galdieria sulphuraria]